MDTKDKTTENKIPEDAIKPEEKKKYFPESQKTINLQENHFIQDIQNTFDANILSSRDLNKV